MIADAVLEALLEAGATAEMIVAAVKADSAAEVSRFYVYKHFGKTSHELFYIGKGTGKRDWSTAGRNPAWADFVEKEGGFFSVVEYDNMTEQQALDLESELIRAYHKDCPLVNIVGVPK